MSGPKHYFRKNTIIHSTMTYEMFALNILFICQLEVYVNLRMPSILVRKYLCNSCQKQNYHYFVWLAVEYFAVYFEA